MSKPKQMPLEPMTADQRTQTLEMIQSLALEQRKVTMHRKEVLKTLKAQSDDIREQIDRHLDRLEADDAMGAGK